MSDAIAEALREADKVFEGKCSVLETVCLVLAYVSLR